jgi:hypothetical protein
MKDFFTVLVAPKQHATILKTHVPSVIWSTRNEAMAIADSLARQTGNDYVVLGVVGRTGPSSPRDNSYEFHPAVGSCGGTP